jgi:hypothetical protein
MRRFLIACVCALAAPLAADGGLPAASSPSASVAAAATSPVALSPAAAVGAAVALSPVAASSSSGTAAVSLSPAAAVALSSTVAVALSATAAVALSPSATVLVTPVATPTPVAFVPLPGPESHVSLVDPSWAVALKVGGALPLGDLATYNQSGPAANLDLYYRADASFRVDLSIDYFSEAYRLGAGDQPLSVAGLGLKLLYDMANVQGVVWYLGGGLGGYYVQRTQQVLEVPVLNNTPVYDPTPNSTMGLGLMGVLGGSYDFENGWGMMVEINVLNINLAGGTSGNMLLAQPVIGLSYGL